MTPKPASSMLRSVSSRNKGVGNNEESTFNSGARVGLAVVLILIIS
jgi:hypothetical protein